MMGKQPDDSYIQETYGVELVNALPQPTPPGDSGDSSNPATQDFAEDDLEPLVQALDAIDDEDWDALASPIIKPILDQAKADPEALIADLGSLYPQLDSTALEQQLAQILFVADIVARLDAKVSA